MAVASSLELQGTADLSFSAPPPGVFTDLATTLLDWKGTDYLA